jgi:plasmid maintenance system killer protein
MYFYYLSSLNRYYQECLVTSKAYFLGRTFDFIRCNFLNSLYLRFKLEIIFMIIDFFDKGTEDIYNGIDSKKARKTLPVKLKRIALRKFYFLDNAINIEDLRKSPSNHLELLQGDRQG